ncbi:SDR family oxidoreductase [Streptacidiphilus rugosus]|uniref:SDR family oxidoreductase n=1 Tax=Streptacidiphilus rugosus TaxID=405783 RepID=UPI00055DE55B|nr:NAD(P)H-binding protein [Streptacidiphilus rugosus]
MGDAEIVVTGGTGVLGRAVVARLRERGEAVRVLSRRERPADAEPGLGWARADLSTGEGVDAALAGAAAVVHCATGFGGDQEATLMRNLVAGARRAPGVTAPHLVYVSIVGVERIPFGYYRAKLAAEELLSRSGLPWTVQRATQFHDLLRALFAATARAPLMVVPDLRFQPVDVRDVATRLAELAVAAPLDGWALDIGGPETRTAPDLARAYLAATGRHRPLLPFRLPGRTFSAFRAGGNLVPGEPYGHIAFGQYLSELPAPRSLPYRNRQG